MDTTTNTKTYEPSKPTQLLQQSTKHVVTAYILMQTSAAKGIKVYGDPAVIACQKEIYQLHDKGVFAP
jgi:hypothetical protein